MTLVTNLLIFLVALLHFFFLVLEMFYWTKPLGLKSFHMREDDALKTQVLAANQGLYNGFLVAGLIWALMNPNPQFSYELAVFFLSCIIAAGLYGGYSVHKRIFLIQGIPAVIALVAVVLSR